MTATKGIPAHLTSFDLGGFVAYLVEHGADILDPTNPYEVVRYRLVSDDGKNGVHILYQRRTGALTWAGWTGKHYRDFQRDRAPGEPVKPLPKRKKAQPGKGKSRSKVASLLQRDGDCCWYCAKPLGMDATREHLVPRSKGGGDTLANQVLAHARCNQRADDRPLSEKIELRAVIRAEVEAGIWNYKTVTRRARGESVKGE